MTGVFDGTPRPDGLTDAQWTERLRSYEHWRASMEGYAEQLGAVEWRAYELAKRAGYRLAYWRTDKAGFPCNGGDLDGAAYAGKWDKVNGILKLCTRQALHATMRPPRWKGQRLWIVALRGEVAGDAEKFGALERLIIGEVRE